MFGRKPKHEFTCPDVIYIQNRAKRTRKIVYTTNLVLIAGVWVWGTVLERRLDAEFEAETNNEETPTDN